MQYLTSFISGALFALGLAISGMINPQKVVGFLDFFGAWDPTLGFVMGGALAVFLPGYRLVMRRQHPVLAESFDLPTRTKITPQLVIGAAIFGVGWGICGMCPAAAVSAVPSMSMGAIAVTVGMAAGIVAMRSARNIIGAKLAAKEPEPVADF